MSPQAISNRVQLSLVEEGTFNTIPATPAMIYQRYTESTLTGAPKTKVSAEIVPDRQVSDLILVGKDVTGDIGYEIQNENPNHAFEGVMFNPWTKTPEALGQAQVTAISATAITVTGGFNWKQYQLVSGTGCTNAGNNRVVVAGAATSGTSIVITGGTIETPPAGVRMKQIGFEGPASDLAATASGLSSTTLDFTTMNLAVGMWIYVGGLQAVNTFATAGVTGWCRISVIAAHALTFDQKPATWGVDAGTGKNIRCYYTDYVRNGTTRKSYVIEQSFLDITQYQYITGAVFDTMDVSAKAQDIMSCKFTVMGAGHSLVSVRTTGATDVIPTPCDVMNSSSNVGQIRENGVVMSAGPNYVMGFGINVANKLRGLTAIGSLTPVAINPGQCLVTGTIDAYFGDLTLMNHLINNTRVSFDAVMKDAAGNALFFDVPQMKMASGSVGIPGIDQDLMTNMTFQAIKHPTLGYTLHIQQFELIGA